MMMSAKEFATKFAGRVVEVINSLGPTERRGERWSVAGYDRDGFLIVDAPGRPARVEDVILRPLVHGARRLPMDAIRLIIEEPAKVAAEAPKAATFWLVWSPTGAKPPHYRHTSESSARTEAERLAREHRGARFYVLEAKCFSECGKVVTVDLVDSENEIPF
jgi:hypothetical protein